MLGVVFIMSSKSTILLTDDNEHWYNDCSEPLTGNNEKPYKDVITLEFSKKNIRIDLNDDEVKTIIESFCDQLKAAGIDRFEKYVKDVYEEDPDSVSFYD